MWKHVSYHCVGTKNHSECQDAVMLVENENWLVAALSDGLASRVHSHIASQTSVKCVCDYFDGEACPDENDIRAEILVPLLQNAIVNEAQAKNLSEKEMNCTLVFVAVDKKIQQAYVGILGDSAVCVIGKEQSTVYSDSSISDGGTFTVMGSDAIERFQIRKIDLLKEQILGFILTSDGLDGELFTKGSVRLQKAAEYYFNSLVGGNNSEQAYEYISQRVDKLTKTKGSTYDDDISLAVLSCAEKPIMLPVDPTWLCSCGYRNTLQKTYCDQCKADFLEVYPNIKFKEHGGKAAFFTQLNQDPQQEAEMAARTKTGRNEEPTSDVAKGGLQRKRLDSGSDAGKNLGDKSSAGRPQGSVRNFAQSTDPAKAKPVLLRSMPSSDPVDFRKDNQHSTLTADTLGVGRQTTHQKQGFSGQKGRKKKLTFAIDAGKCLGDKSSTGSVQGSERDLAQNADAAKGKPVSARSLPSGDPVDFRKDNQHSMQGADSRGVGQQTTYQNQGFFGQRGRKEQQTKNDCKPVQPSITNHRTRGRHSVYIAAAVGIMIILITVASMISNHAGFTKGKNAGIEQGYSVGFAAGELSGREQAETELQESYNTAVLQAQQDFEERYLEQYQAGYEQGKTDAISNPQDYRIKLGSSGSIVETIQRLLFDKGWNIQIDGKFGPEMERIVCEFQKKNNLAETGEIDVLTYWALISDESIGMTVAEESSPSSILTDSEATPTPMPEIAPPEYATPTATNSMSFDECVDG